MGGVSLSPLIPRSSISSCGIWGSRSLFSVAIPFCVLLSSCEAKSLLPQSAPNTQEFQQLAEVTEGAEAKSAAVVVTSGAEENVKSGSEKLSQANLEESSSQSNSTSLQAIAPESSFVPGVTVYVFLGGAFGAISVALAVSRCLPSRKKIPSKEVSVDVSIPKLFFNEGSSSDASALPHSFLSTDPTRADISIASCETVDQLSPVNNSLTQKS